MALVRFIHLAVTESSTKAFLIGAADETSTRPPAPIDFWETEYKAIGLFQLYFNLVILA